MELRIREFPDDLHRWIKVKAAQESTTLAELTMRILRERMDREEKKK